MRFLIAFIALLFTGTLLSGQTGEVVDTSQGELFLRVKNINFFKNGNG